MLSENDDHSLTSTLKLTQNWEDKHIPTLRRGTQIDSHSSNDKREPGSLGVLFRFQPDVLYLQDSDGSDKGNPLPSVVVSRSLP